MLNLMKLIWKVFDVLCYLAAAGFIIWGLFLINLVAGLFGIGIALILVGLGSEILANQGGGS